jgi:hypothetical protein
VQPPLAPAEVLENKKEPLREEWFYKDKILLKRDAVNLR